MSITNRDAEFRATITALYREELGRDPDPGGLTAWLEQCRNGMTGEQLRAALHDSPEGVAYRSKPTPPPLPHLEIRGNDFVDAWGRPVCLSGVDQFIAFRMFRDQRFAELEALVAESHEFGFQFWRVFLMGSKAQNTIFDLSPNEPGYADDLRKFPRWLNARGIGLLAEAYVDNQDLKIGLDHWTICGDCLRWTCSILSGGNEYEKNGFDPQALSDPGNLMWSRGSNLADKLTPQNGAPCASFHQRTDWPATLMDAVASEVYMEQHGYTVCLMDEPTRFNLDGSNKSNVPDSARFAFVLARIYGSLWDLVVFHNQSGQRGIPFTPELRSIAAAWQRGLRA